MIVLWYLRIAQREKPSKSHGRTLRGRLFRILEDDCPRRERQSGRGADQRGLRCCSTPETDPATAPVLPIASRAPREKPEKCRDKKSKGMVGKNIESECLRRERQSGVKLTKRGLRYGTRTTALRIPRSGLRVRSSAGASLAVVVHSARLSLRSSNLAAVLACGPLRVSC